MDLIAQYQGPDSSILDYYTIIVYIVYTENTKSIFGKNINWLVKKLAPLLLAEFLGFGTESDITRLS